MLIEPGAPFETPNAVSKFEFLLAWMQHWGVMSPKEQAEFINSKELDELDAYLLSDIKKHMRSNQFDKRPALEDFVKTFPFDSPSSKEQRESNESIRNNIEKLDDLKSERERLSYSSPGILLIGIPTFIYLLAAISGENRAGFFVLFVPIIYLVILRNWKKPKLRLLDIKITSLEKDLDQTRNKKTESYSAIDETPIFWNEISKRALKGKFNRGKTTPVHPDKRFETLVNSDRKCTECQESPPFVHLTVIDDKASGKSNTPPTFTVICTGCLSKKIRQPLILKKPGIS
ncbi:MAG: hypothetical protein CL517_01175 [Actinobacteria bacterium]|nr:hypothetical protein [Actinomycetota bacterium]|tara:strand:+ start:107 stop:970 length:864 start_codon:yes stop_codon:yes gene_type:complete